MLDPEVLRIKNKMRRLNAHQFLNFKFCSYLQTALLVGVQHYNIKSRSCGNSCTFPAEGQCLNSRIMLKAMDRILSSP